MSKSHAQATHRATKSKASGARAKRVSSSASAAAAKAGKGAKPKSKPRVDTAASAKKKKGASKTPLHKGASPKAAASASSAAPKVTKPVAAKKAVIGSHGKAKTPEPKPQASGPAHKTEELIPPQMVKAPPEAAAVSSKPAAAAKTPSSSEAPARKLSLAFSQPTPSHSVSGQVPTTAGHAALEGPNRAFRDDPLLDKRIIEGMLDDKEGFLDDMHGEGFSREAVIRRAAELGLSEALIRQVKGVAADLAGERPGKRPTPNSLGARTCLQCDRVFFSSGPGNRLCTRCRGGDAGLAQL